MGRQGFSARTIRLIYLVAIPLVVVLFFTTFLGSGQPTDIPIGIVDQDYTPTTRRMARLLDAFQVPRVAGQYTTVSDARKAIQRGEIYAFLYVPKGTTAKLIASRKPTVSFYYSVTSLTAGSLLYRDLKTITSLANAALIQASLRARGATERQIINYLQPINIDLHQIANPVMDYNVYLSTTLVPGVLTLFFFLIAAYSLGSLLKRGEGKALLRLTHGSVLEAVMRKEMPVLIVGLLSFCAFEFYVYGVLEFPHLGGWFPIVWSALLTVVGSVGFGVFVFGLIPSLRMSMSICSLWAVLSFSLAGSTFPVTSMDAPLEALSWLFPLRHYFMIYQAVVFNGYSVAGVWWHVVALIIFAISPFFVLHRIKHILLNFDYTP